MHPFFQPVQHTRKLASQHVEPQPPTLKNMDLEMSIEQDSSSPGSQLGDSTPSTSATLPQVHQSEDADIDLNEERRKRRRITPCTDLASATDAPITSNTTSQDPQDHAMEELQSDTGFEGNQSQPGGPHEVKVTSHSRGRSDRLYSTTDSEQGPPSLTRQLTINLSPSKPKQLPHKQELGPDLEPKTTTEKRMLHISTDGKLTRSPKRSPAQKVGVRAKVEPSRNLSLKKGRIVSSLVVIIPYSKNLKEGQLTTAEKIDQIINNQRHSEHPAPPNASQETRRVETKPTKATHPFFLGKSAVPTHREAALKASDETSIAQKSDIEAAPEFRRPTAWSDIKFSSSKFVTSKDITTMPPLWPPFESQYHGKQLVGASVPVQLEANSQQSKQKHDTVRILETEDILYRFGESLRVLNSQGPRITIPERRFMRPLDLVDAVQSERDGSDFPTCNKSALQYSRNRLLHSRSAFDRGQAAGPDDWAHAYAPKKAGEVLQPHGRDLAEWLRKMKVHQVQAKLAAGGSDRPRKAARRKGRPKKKQDDMGDFIVASDEEISTASDSVKNAILISGPTGCGKTASVYAAADELEFEVFEIHPGMRRNAKDIFDKVGDMTDNHLVQQVAPLSRDNSTLTAEAENDHPDQEISSSNQQTMTSFISGSKKRKGSQAQASDTRQINPRPVQKQSVILLEEVDILFEEDKSFWAGVQTLIQQSKRPVVLTCSSLDSIPVDELQLHATLHYERPHVDDVAEYLAHVAAAEGHLLSREALSGLYKSRGEDLRGTLMDLDFWCQMTVGSEVGGLDWIHSPSTASIGSTQSIPRVISCGTFHQGLNLVPERPVSPEDLLAFCHHQHGIAALEWEEVRECAVVRGESIPSFSRLDDALDISDARSCMDIIDSSIAPLLSTSVSMAFPFSDSAVTEEAVFQMMCRASSRHVARTPVLTRKDIALSLDPITEDFRTFPPPIGRTSPSIDGAGCSIATEVAPYVRAIVAFDQRLEQQRFELAGGGGSSSVSQGGGGMKQRTTRAARAALEGGDKSNTRRERWFPKELDFEAVLGTGMWYWPQYRDDDRVEDVTAADPETHPD